MKLLAINPGSTSTKVAVFEDTACIHKETIEHKPSELTSFKKMIEQKEYRKRVIISALEKSGYPLSDIDVYVGRGGLVKQVESGVYRINPAYLHDATIGYNGQHASNLGGILAYELAKASDDAKEAYTVDPVVVDEYMDIARLSGMPDISRVKSFHPLNHKAVSRRYAKECGTPYESLNLIVAHLGGGISIGAHCKGKVIDVNAALGGDGPFTPERAGGVPPLPLIDMCYSGKFTYEEMYAKIVSQAGLTGYLGTNDGRDISQRIQNGDKKAALVFEAMAYQIAKEIGAYAVSLKGNVDAIILTGGIAHQSILCDWIVERVCFITENIVIYPGEDEMQALAEGAYLGLTGKLPIKEYTEKHFVIQKNHRHL